MSSCRILLAAATLAMLASSRVSTQQPAAPAPLPPGQTSTPFPQPIERDAGVITVTLREFATLTDIDGVAA